MSDSPSNPFFAAPKSFIKLLVLGEETSLPADWSDQLRSLHIEHVSPRLLVSQEICRRSPLGQSAELAQQRGIPIPAEVIVSLVRRWFMARKPDAGFALSGFPATLLQARIFDEWLDTRDENLDSIISLCSSQASIALVDYYRTHGIPIHERPGAYVFRP